MPNKAKRTAKSYRSLKDLGLTELKELIPNRKLDNGSHDDPGSIGNRDNQLCLMEAVAYITGEPHSDHPMCADPALTDIAISFNDSHRSDRERENLISAIPALVGSRTTSARVRWKRAKALASHLIQAAVNSLEQEFSEAPSLALISELVGLDNLQTKAEAKRSLEIIKVFESDNDAVQEAEVTLERLLERWNPQGLNERSYAHVMPTSLDAVVDGSYEQADLLRDLGSIRN